MQLAGLASLLFAVAATGSAAEVIHFQAWPNSSEHVKLEKSVGIKYSTTSITGELIRARGYHNVFAVRTKPYGDVHLPTSSLADVTGRVALEKLVEGRALVVVRGTLKHLCTPAEAASVAATQERDLVLTCYVFSDAFPAQLSTTK